MKKFARVLALMLVATLLCVMLVACAPTPADTPEDAKAALEENGYEVLVVDNELALASASAIYGGDLEATLRASDGDDNYVSIIWFENEEDAEKYYEELEEEWAEMEEELEEIEDEDEKAEAEEYMDSMTFGQSGNMVWSGTVDGIKAAS